ncbi:hypothetical protein SAMN05444320_10362 [Streptoalloteichus hindustanus]|uniref:Uncharacterized protein n=1 Tax=Streptoalloteichus hindustanus TaxID=2017 RepID=A0A1M5ACS7_STRHI|nr:hypothetical protein SAMN05444320_10362 [Streptoalloteichus hindustanus]
MVRRADRAPGSMAPEAPAARSSGPHACRDRETSRATSKAVTLYRCGCRAFAEVENQAGRSEEGPVNISSARWPGQSRVQVNGGAVRPRPRSAGSLRFRGISGAATLRYPTVSVAAQGIDARFDERMVGSRACAGRPGSTRCDPLCEPAEEFRSPAARLGEQPLMQLLSGTSLTPFAQPSPRRARGTAQRRRPLAADAPAHHGQDAFQHSPVDGGCAAGQRKSRGHAGISGSSHGRNSPVRSSDARCDRGTLRAASKAVTPDLFELPCFLERHSLEPLYPQWTKGKFGTGLWRRRELLSDSGFMPFGHPPPRRAQGVDQRAGGRSQPMLVRTTVGMPSSTARSSACGRTSGNVVDVLGSAAPAMAAARQSGPPTHGVIVEHTAPQARPSCQNFLGCRASSGRHSLAAICPEWLIRSCP